MAKVTIIGSGIAGLGAAHFCYEQKIDTVIFEQDNYYGGHTASHCFKQGFVFDEGPHVSFTTNERIKQLLADSVRGEYYESSVIANNYWQGHWIKHPAQCNLYGLPVELVSTIIKEFFQLQQCPERNEINNYEDWLYASFGKTFSRTFPMEYTKKFHTTDAKNLSTDWLGPRLYRPNIDEVLRGALSETTDDVHYVTDFRYPKYGGFQSYLRQFVEESAVQLNHRIIEVDVKKKTLRFANGSTCDYDYLVSSMPLPEIIKVIKDVPREVAEAGANLACSEAVVVNLGITRPNVHNAHWTYFYDADIFFTRLSTPYLQSPHNVPEGCSSLQVECYFSRKYKPLNVSFDSCVDAVMDGLIKCGILYDDDEMTFKHVMHIPYANVIFDLDRKASLAIVHGFLDEYGIVCCGRYGLWKYIWTDQAFMSGENAARKLVGKIK
jgi:protoporphyrinogen oxidase